MTDNDGTGSGLNLQKVQPRDPSPGGPDGASDGDPGQRDHGRVAPPRGRRGGADGRQSGAGPRGDPPPRAGGLIEIFPHRGAVVIGLPEAEIDAIYELRSVIEGRAIAAAIDVVGEPELARLEALIDEMRAAIKARDVEAIAEFDLQFHGLIVDWSGLTLLRHIWSSLDGLVRVRSFQALDRPGSTARYFLKNAATSHLRARGRAARRGPGGGRDARPAARPRGAGDAGRAGPAAPGAGTRRAPSVTPARESRRPARGLPSDRSGTDRRPDPRPAADLESARTRGRDGRAPGSGAVGRGGDRPDRSGVPEQPVASSPSSAPATGRPSSGTAISMRSTSSTRRRSGTATSSSVAGRPT